MERIVDADVKLSLSEPFELKYTSEMYNSRNLCRRYWSTPNPHRQCRPSCRQQQLQVLSSGISASPKGISTHKYESLVEGTPMWL